jgi:sarcosine oxidase subunit alpha
MSASGTGPYRVARGGHIERSRPLSFVFNGRQYTGFAGDSLASALLANGVRTVARSFKFHRPRGVISCGVEEAGALLQLGDGVSTVPSVRAPLVELTQGLNARSQIGWPSLGFDVGACLDRVAPLWAAGFYNKTFIWPSWHAYESIIRTLAGLGKVPPGPDPDRYERSSLHCDVLVVGGGVAGLKAALDAGSSGARVVLAEQDHALGGTALWNGGTIDGQPAHFWIDRAMARLREMPDVRIFARTTATAFYDHNVLTLLERVHRLHEGGPRERSWTVRTSRVVLATGSIEQPLIFEHNDRPGIVLAGAARQYLLRYGVAIGSRVLIATNNDSVYTLARELKEAGVQVLGVVDTRSSVSSELLAAMRAISVEVFPSSIPVSTRGGKGLCEVTVGKAKRDGSDGTSRVFQCDALAVSGGFTPTLHLYAQAGGKLGYDDASGALLPVSPHPDIEIVGAAATSVAIGPRISVSGKSHRKWVDLLNDVTVADLELALRENFRSVEHVKRYTTAGMAVDQGKTSAPAVLNTLGELQRVSARELGHTTFRPPFTPVTLGAIAGREIGERFAPHRLLPMHDWHVANGGLMQDFGEWQRAVAYVRPGESRHEATKREARTVRTAAGLFDGSSLGKIEIHGPDALEFVDRFYINDLSALRPCRARYGLMLRETGTIFDDGTVVVLGPDRVLLTTTSGNAGRVVQWLEEWRQCEWPQTRVAIVPVTEAWATLALAGPRARDILSRIATDVDLTPAAFPHLAVRECSLMGHDARIYRVSFTGELSYEINVPTSKASALWERLMHEGAGDGLQQLGLDALMLLRLEKGFLHLGSETDGTTVPDDVGWGKVATNKQRDYVGKRSLTLPENLRRDRMQLVGLRGLSSEALVIGSHLRAGDSSHSTDGWITSAGTTVLTKEHIALAMMRGGRAKVGAEVDLHDAGKVVGRARVVNPPFFDAAGERMNA